MSSIAQIEANRRNCRKSTGPRTPEGRAACCRNATKHGLLSSQVLLACESRQELDEHSRALRESLRPVGPVEELLADRVAAQAWRLRRVMQLETAILDETVGRFDALPKSRDAGDTGDAERRGDARKGDTETGEGGGGAEPGRVPAAIAGRAVRDFLQEGLRGLDILRRYERATEQGLYQAMRELSALQSSRSDDDETRSRENQERVEAILNDPRLPAVLHQYATDVKAERSRDARDTRDGKRDAERGMPRRSEAMPGDAEPADETEPIRQGASKGTRDAGDGKKDAGRGLPCEAQRAKQGDAETRREREEEEKEEETGAESDMRYAEAAA